MITDKEEHWWPLVWQTRPGKQMRYAPGPTPWFDDQMWGHPLPRLIRFASAGGLPAGVIAKVDRETNLVVINKEIFDQQDSFTQRKLLRAHYDVTSV